MYRRQKFFMAIRTWSRNTQPARWIVATLSFNCGGPMGPVEKVGCKHPCQIFQTLVDILIWSNLALYWSFVCGHIFQSRRCICSGVLGLAPCRIESNQISKQGTNPANLWATSLLSLIWHDFCKANRTWSRNTRPAHQTWWDSAWPRHTHPVPMPMFLSCHFWTA